MAGCSFVGVVGLGSVLLLLVLGTDPSEGNCLEKMQECLQIATNLAGVASSGEDYTALCPSSVQNLTQCVESAKTVCSDQPQTLNTLQSQLDSMEKTLCSADGVCGFKVGSCAKPILSIVENAGNITAATVMQLCSVAPAMSSCLQKLDAKCLKLPKVAPMIPHIKKMSTYCGYMSNGGACTPAVSCFTALADPANRGSLPCNIIGSILDCLKEKAKLGNCSLDESKVTFADLSAMTVDVCPVANNRCAVAEVCISVPDLPRNPFGEETTDSNPQAVAKKLTDPNFFCQLVNKAAGCYSTFKDRCGFKPELMNKIEAKHERLRKQCPGGAPRGTSPGMLCYLMVLLPLLMFMWQ